MTAYRESQTLFVCDSKRLRCGRIDLKAKRPVSFSSAYLNLTNRNAVNSEVLLSSAEKPSSGFASSPAVGLIRTRLFRISRYFELTTISFGFASLLYYRLFRIPTFSSYFSFPQLRVRKSTFALHAV